MRNRKVSYYIFVATDMDKSRLSLPSASQVASICAQKGRWGLGNRTQHKMHLQGGDLALVYLAGVRENSQRFIASAAIASPTVNAPLTIAQTSWPLSVGLVDYAPFPYPVQIKPLLPKLSF